MLCMSADEFRRQGIGSQLIDRAIERMRAANAIAVETIYDAWNEASDRLASGRICSRGWCMHTGCYRIARDLNENYQLHQTRARSCIETDHQRIRKPGLKIRTSRSSPAKPTTTPSKRRCASKKNMAAKWSFISMGGEEAARVLRSGLAMGADRAIHLLDPKFKGSDEFATAAALAKAIEKDGGADLVLAGVQSDDLGTGMTGTMMAEFLGWRMPRSLSEWKRTRTANLSRVRRELEGGINETVELPMPARSDDSIRNQSAPLCFLERHHGGEKEGVQSVVGRRSRSERRRRWQGRRDVRREGSLHSGAQEQSRNYWRNA